MYNTQVSIVSVNDDTYEMLLDDFERISAEKYLARRRCLKLIGIPVVFIISFGLLLFSVLHDNRSIAYEEDQGCELEDCQELWCPVGMSWMGKQRGCEVITGKRK